MFGDQITLNNTGLFRVGTDVKRFVIAVQRLTRRFFVKEHDRYVLPACFFNDRACRCRVNQVNRQCFNSFCQQHVDLVVLFGLVVLRVIHQQLYIWRRFGIFFNSLTYYRHKVIVILIDSHTNAGISSVRSRAE